jgi:hypothetical protein
MYNNTKQCAYFHQLPNVVQLLVEEEDNLSACGKNNR